VWTEEEVRARLERFLAGRTEWPRARDFAEAGESVLRRAIAREGGAPRWAAEFGIPYVERRGGGAVVWSEERVETELARFLGDRSAWPGAGEFERAGERALWQAIGRFGGPERWAFRFGLRPSSRRAGSRRTWTDARIEQRLRRFVAGRGDWPRVAEFEAAGLGSLFTAIYQYGGVEHWAARVGLASRPRRGGERRRWTDASVRHELARFSGRLGRWPRQRDFAAAGLMPLYWAASRTRGLAAWEAELGASAIAGQTVAAA
jgi:hypothetical protein